MKNTTNIVLAAFIAAFSIFGFMSAAQAQTTSTTAVCPAGYTCAPYPTCPAGYTCTAVPQPAGCPTGYICSGATTTTVGATASILTTPSLELSYDSAQSETSLKASFQVTVTAGNQDLAVDSSFANVIFYDQNSNRAMASSYYSQTRFLSSAGNVNFDGSKYLLKANQTAVFIASATMNPKELFAGIYHASLDTFQGISLNANSTNIKSIVGEVSPYITGFESAAVSGKKLTVVGVRFSVPFIDNPQIYIDNQLQTFAFEIPADGKTISFIFPVMPIGYHSLYVKNLKGASNTYSFYAGVQSTAAASVAASELSLTYNTAQKENLLKATFVLSVDGGKSGLYVYDSNQSVDFYNNANGTNYRASSMMNSLLSVYGGTLNSATDERGRKVFIIPAGKTARFLASTTVDPKQLFAGTYYASIDHIYANVPGASADSAFSLQVAKNKTNLKTIVGETGPYITGFGSSGSFLAGQGMTVIGQRLTQNVFIDNAALTTGVKGDGYNIGFMLPSNLAAGYHNIFVRNNTTGDSNRFGFEVKAGDTTIPPTTGSCYTFSKYLSYGSTGADVVALQLVLVNNGFLAMPAGVPMGSFDGVTAAAVARYQAAVGISNEYGSFLVGPYTIAKLNSTCGSVPTIPTNPIETRQSVTPSSSNIKSGESVKFTFVFPSNTVRATLYLACPAGVTDPANVICNKYMDLTSNRDYTTPLMNASAQAQNVVPNYYVYTSDNPNFAKGVTSQVTVQAAGMSVPVAATHEVSLNAWSPKSATIIASSGPSQNEVDMMTVLVLNFKTLNNNAVVDSIRTTLSGAAVSKGMIPTAYLYEGSTQIGSASVGQDGIAKFAELGMNVLKDQVKTYTIKIDVRGAEATASSVSAKVSYNDISTKNSGIVTGSAIGESLYIVKKAAAQIPTTVDLKINGSDGPITVTEGDAVNLTWTSSGPFTNCGSVGTGSMVLQNWDSKDQPAQGSAHVVASIGSNNSNAFMFICNDKDPLAPKGIDKVIVNVIPKAVVTVPATTTPPVAEIPSSVSVSPMTTFEDHVGMWGVFGPGKGAGNYSEGIKGGSSDWGWTANVAFGSAKTIKSMTLTHEGSNQTWSTSNPSNYPLVVFNNGKQLNTAYGASLGSYQAGTQTFTMYGQIDNVNLSGSKLSIQFTDGTSIVGTIAPAGVKPPQATAATSTSQMGQGANAAVFIDILRAIFGK